MRALALRLARSTFGGWAAWLALGPLANVAPIRILAQGEHVRAFRHPKPAYSTHLVITPKRRILDYLGASPALLGDVLDVAARVAGNEAVELVTNLGRYQEVRLLHFHLIPRRAAEPDATTSRDLDAFLAESITAARRTLTETGAARVLITPAEGATATWRVTA